MPKKLTADNPLVTIDFVPATPDTTAVISDVLGERVKQVEKWGVQSRDTGANASFAKARDIAQRRTDAKMKDGSVTWHDILFEELLEAIAEEDTAKMRVELIQLAAVAVSAVEDIDRKAAKEAS